MAKEYEDLKVEKPTSQRFKRAKHLYEFQNGRDYTMSEFLDELVDFFGKKVAADFDREKKV
jgi:hypothetical protein